MNVGTKGLGFSIRMGLGFRAQGKGVGSEHRDAVVNSLGMGLGFRV